MGLQVIERVDGLCWDLDWDSARLSARYPIIEYSLGFQRFRVDLWAESEGGQPLEQRGWDERSRESPLGKSGN